MLLLLLLLLPPLPMPLLLPSLPLLLPLADGARLNSRKMRTSTPTVVIAAFCMLKPVFRDLFCFGS